MRHLSLIDINDKHLQWVILFGDSTFIHVDSTRDWIGISAMGVREGQYLTQKWPKFGFGALQRPPIWSRTTGPQMFPPIAPDWFESISGTRKLLRLIHGLGRCVEAVFDWKWDPTSIEWKLHLFHFAWLVPHLNHFLYMPACQKRPETLKTVVAGCC